MHAMPAQDPQPRTLHIRHSTGAYDATIGPALSRTGELAKAALPQARRIAVVLDPLLERVAPARIALVLGALRAANFEVHVCTPALAAGPWRSAEANKTLEAAQSICAHLAAAQLDRRDALVAIGGGLLIDLAGLAAAHYRRGIAWIAMPTTLLAVIDASVGGKTAANLTRDDGSLLKNMLGVFHQPAQVLVDPAWLETLDARQLASGLAEHIKHAMITGSVLGATDHVHSGGGGPDAARAAIDRFRASPAGAIALLESNIALKARVVEQDELERAPDHQGGRALLNLGHTFGHAIEALGPRADTPTYPATPIQHGEAVGLGLIAASHAAAALNMVPQSHADAVRAAVAHAGLPTTLRTTATDADLLALMRQDKKTLANTLRVILPTGPATAKVIANPDPAALATGWRALARPTDD
jgi:3-dehydroquinate synthetase